MYVPFIGRLSVREYAAVVFGFVLYTFETVLRVIIFFLPQSLIRYLHDLSRLAFYRFVLGTSPDKPKSAARELTDRIRDARDFAELCTIWGYTHEEHVVLTKDGYLLGLHRIPAKKGERRTRPGTSTGRPVVYLHHGLLMNSEVWLCLTDEERSIPLVLAEQGFDVWLGNNRGNKYSKKSIHHSPNSVKFWDYSMDEFAWHDIPDSIEYILGVTKEPSLSYIGFSQGTAQAFAALSIHPQLNQKVNVFVALAPAMSPAGLSAPVVDGLMKASPTLLFLFFGRKSILPSALAWQNMLYPPIFAKVIDLALRFLFAWDGANILPAQKIAAYAHLYSFSSTKAVVHWFQIMRNGSFQMYDDDVDANTPLRYNPTRARTASSASYVPLRFPTRNIATPVTLLWGDRDSLVDIDVMLAQLPVGTRERRLRGYEHVDVLWGKDVHLDVIPEVLEVLKAHCEGPGRLAGLVNGVDTVKDVE